MLLLETLESMNKIILVSDTIEGHKDATLESRTLEFTENEYFNRVFNTLKEISEVIHYESPVELIKNANIHKNDTVISLWSGINSRNRRALVPSICEAYGIRYIGADAYTSIICQDKATSHEYCRRFNIKSPDYILIESLQHIDLIELLHPPLVVKPNFEGGSIGIDKNNLVFNLKEAKLLATKLYNLFNEQIMVQSFARGDEVSFILFGSKNDIEICECVKLELLTKELNIRDTIYSLDIKKRGIYEEKNEIITSQINPVIIENVKALFKSFDKVEILRVDGRLNQKGEFYCIELSPDVWLDEKSSVYNAFHNKGFAFKEMFIKLLENSHNSNRC